MPTRPVLKLAFTPITLITFLITSITFFTTPPAQRTDQ